MEKLTDNLETLFKDHTLVGLSDNSSNLSLKPDNLYEVIDNKKYHHKEKGCDMLYLTYKDKRGCFLEMEICQTHNKLCSRGGWEQGWYLGTDSKKIFKKYSRK